MATTPATKTSTNKPKREPVSFTARITQQLDRAVLGRKVTKEELEKLGTHIAKLNAFLEA